MLYFEPPSPSFLNMTDEPDEKCHFPTLFFNLKEYVLVNGPEGMDGLEPLILAAGKAAREEHPRSGL